MAERTAPTVEELDKLLNDPNTPNVIVQPDGSCREILSCGHDLSNRVTTLESGTVFCGLCDLESRCRDAETREKELFTLLSDANDLCRSVYSIANRDGKATNWEAFRAKLGESLERQRKGLHLMSPQDEFKAAT